MSIREVLATNLKRARRAAGLSQEEFAHRAGVDRTYVSAIERQKYAITIDILARLAAVLDVDPADLLRRPHGVEAPAKSPVVGAGAEKPE